MGSQELQLWGFDGTFGGEEGRIRLCLPVCVASTGKCFAARGSDWSLDPERHIVWFRNKLDALENVSSLNLKEPVGILPGCQIALMGSDYAMHLRNIAPEIFWENFLRGWILLSNHFSFKCMKAEEYDKMQEELGKLALNVFDHEIHAGQGKNFMSKAQSALKIIRVSPKVPLFETAIRVIAAEIITLNKYLAVHALRLKKSPSELREAAEMYLKNS